MENMFLRAHLRLLESFDVIELLVYHKSGHFLVPIIQDWRGSTAGVTANEPIKNMHVLILSQS